MGALHPIEHDPLPLPNDIEPGKGWSAVMIDMAAHIGTRSVLELCDRYGGQQVYFPIDPKNAPLVDVLGGRKARALCKAYQKERITIPTARHALARARRGGIIAAVRAGTLSVGMAAAKLGIRRDTLSALVRRTDEGRDWSPSDSSGKRCDPSQLDLFGECEGSKG